MKAAHARHVPWSVGRRIAATVRRVGRRAGESLRAVVLLGVALCVALTAAMTFISLQKTSAEHRESRHLLSSLRSDLYESLYLQEEAIVLGGLDAELDVELQASLDRGAARVAGLRRFESEGVQESVTERLFASYRGALEDEAVLLRAGDIDGARRLEDLRVDPVFHDLADVIDQHLADHEAAADRLELQADVGSVVTLSVAAMVIWLLASRQRKAHLAAERASAQRRATEESERRFRSLVQQSSDMTMVVSPDLDIRYVAPSAAQVLGYEPDEFCHLAKGLLHPDDVAKLRGRVAELARGASGAGMAIEYRIRHRDGGWRTWRRWPATP